MYKNIIWDLVGKFGIQIVSFVISILLTRLLSPEEYGIMGMAMVVVSFAHIFLDLGFNRAIVQQQDVSPLQYSTVFYLNAGVALLLTALCFFLAGPLAVFYNQPLIKPVFKVVSFSFLLNGLNLVPSAMLYKRMQFKVNSIQSLVSAVLSGGLGVYMAYAGFGVWSLVAQSMTASALLLLMNVAYVRWYPRLAFSIQSIRQMWKYGSRLFASGVLDMLYTRMDTFIIGKLFSPFVLGYYARAQGMDNMVRQFSAGSFVGALFPQITKHQHDRQFLKQLYVKYLHIIMFVSVGMSGVLMLIAKDLFALLFTARWNYSAELFQIMAVTGFAWPVSSLMCGIISGVGNSKAFLRLEILKKTMLLPVYVFGFLFGLKGFLYWMLCAMFCGVALNGWYASKEIAVSLWQQCRLMLAYLMVGFLAFLVAYISASQLQHLHLVLRMIAVGSVFGAAYIGGAYMAKLGGTQVITFGANKLKTAFQ